MTLIEKSKEQVLDFVQSEYDGYTDITYIGEWESFDCYEIKTDEDTDGVGAFALVNEDGVAKSYYHESVAIARKFGL